MPSHTLIHLVRGQGWSVVVFTAVLSVLSGAVIVDAQETLVYSFEPDLEGFFSVPAAPTLTLSHETSGLGATHGSNSMKFTHARFNGFAGARTANIHSAFLDPLGVDFVRFDLTNTNRFAPSPTDPPTPGVPTFADISLTFFGDLPGNPTSPAQIQYLFSQVPVGSLEPGTHEIEIDLRNDGGDLGQGGGLNVDTGVFQGYDTWTDAGFVPLEFQIYLNKSISVSDPAFEWTIYIDNVRVGRDVEGVVGDFNDDGAVNAADYVTWRKNDGTNNALPNDNGLGTPITSAHYDLWRANFGQPMPGGGGFSAIPEPMSAWLMATSGVCWYVSRRVRTARSRA
ncbi:MAG: hypothetical protein WD738_01080 [Pirellulales bacterium]